MSSAPVGRPRDAGLDDRVFHAALVVYGRQGWSGFSIEAVAREARVGKASIYLRWSSKTDLLADALASVVPDASAIDTGSLRSDLIALGMPSVDNSFGAHADAFLRLHGEARHIPELAARWDAMRDSQVRTARSIVRRAIGRGELPARTPVTVMLDAIFGGIMMNAITVPPHLRDKAKADAPAHLEALIDLILAGIGERVAATSPEQAEG